MPDGVGQFETGVPKRLWRGETLVVVTGSRRFAAARDCDLPHAVWRTIVGPSDGQARTQCIPAKLVVAK